MNYGSQRIFLPSHVQDKHHGANTTSYYLGKDLFEKLQAEHQKIQQNILKNANKATIQQRNLQKKTRKTNPFIEAQIKERVKISQFMNYVNVLM